MFWSCVIARSGIGLALVLLFLQAPSVIAQDPSVRSGSSAAERPPGLSELSFDESRHTGLREGHVSLSWNEIEGAEEYRLTDDTGAVLYRGAFERAFVSGLPDGTHTFTVQALGADGEVLASSQQPAVLEVNHWPLAQAWALFAVGLIVVVSLISVIISGAIRTRPVRPGAESVTESTASAAEGS